MKIRRPASAAPSARRGGNPGSPGVTLWGRNSRFTGHADFVNAGQQAGLLRPLVQKLYSHCFKNESEEASMSIHDEITRANERYAASFAKGNLPMPPGRRFAVLTCMDARLDPAKFLGLDEGDAHVIRNAGGLASADAIRSLVISHWLLGTQEAFVIAHSDCGMLTFTNEVLRARLQEEADADASGIDFLPFSDLEESVRASIRRIRESPFLPDSFAASGFVYRVESGQLREVTD